MKRYSDYKDSGVEWLGEIPEHWEVKRLKLMARIKNGQDYKLVYTDEPIYPVIGSGGQFAYASQYLFKGESVLLGRKGTVDKPLYINCAFWTVDTMFYSEINNNTFPKFLYYSALTIPFKYLLTNTTVPSMTQYDLGNHLFAFAPIDEQKTIARFLDRKLEQIGHFISNKQRLIELLKEQKTAIVNRAVTKGLNHHAPMKPSGIDWLGEIPQHWEIKRLGWICSQINDINHEMPPAVAEGVPFLSAKDLLDDGTLNFTHDLKMISEEDFQKLSKKVLPRKNDIIYSRIGARLGKARLVKADTKFLISYSCCVVRVKQEIAIPELIRLILDSEFVLTEAKLRTVGVGVPDLGLKEIARFPIPLPPMKEQEKITKYLIQEIANIDLAIAKTEKEIELIQEYRTTLISDAVTGKIDVRELTHSS